jgi:hypothetical protein
MSGECSQCGEHALECQCIIDRNQLAIAIFQCILEFDPQALRHLPDALIQVFVHLAHKNQWTAERTQREVASAISYYYSHEQKMDKQNEKTR